MTRGALFRARVVDLMLFPNMWYVKANRPLLVKRLLACAALAGKWRDGSTISVPTSPRKIVDLNFNVVCFFIRGQGWKRHVSGTPLLAQHNVSDSLLFLSRAFCLLYFSIFF